MTGLLPEEFAVLEPFAQRWAADRASARADLRDRASAEEMAVFYAAVQPVLAPALTWLDAIPLAQHDDRQRQLMHLLISFTHVAVAVEVQQEDEPRHARLRQHMRITRAPADIL